MDIDRKRNALKVAGILTAGGAMELISFDMYPVLY